MSLSRPAATTPSLSAVCDFEQSLCGWSADPQSGVSWSLHTASSSSTGHDTRGTRQDLALGSDSEYWFAGNQNDYTHMQLGFVTRPFPSIFKVSFKIFWEIFVACSSYTVSVTPLIMSSLQWHKCGMGKFRICTRNMLFWIKTMEDLNHLLCCFQQSYLNDITKKKCTCLLL